MSWRVVGLTAGLLALPLAAGLALGFVGTALGAAERVVSGTTGGSATDPGPGTTTAAVATTTAPPPDPAPVTIKKPAPKRAAAPVRAPRVADSVQTPAKQQPSARIVTPTPPPPSIASRRKAATPVKRAPAPKPRATTTSASARPRAQLPIPIPSAAPVLFVSTASDFTRAPILVTLGLAIFLLGAAVIPPRAIPSAGLAWILSSQTVAISFAGLTLLLVAGIEYVVMKVAS